MYAARFSRLPLQPAQLRKAEFYSTSIVNGFQSFPQRYYSYNGGGGGIRNPVPDADYFLCELGGNFQLDVLRLCGGRYSEVQHLRAISRRWATSAYGRLLSLAEGWGQVSRNFTVAFPGPFPECLFMADCCPSQTMEPGVSENFTVASPRRLPLCSVLAGYRRSTTVHLTLRSRPTPVERDSALRGQASNLEGQKGAGGSGRQIRPR
jgi:hypothetical protein